MFKINRVKFTILILIVFITLLPRVDFLTENAITSSLGMVALLGVLSLFWNKYKVDTVIFFLLFLGLSLTKLRYSDVDEMILLLRFASASAFFFLSFALVIGPLSRFSSFFLDFYRYRRHIGVTTYFLGLLHAEIVVVYIFQGDIKSLQLVSYTYFGLTTIYILTFMAATSWNYLQKHVSLLWWSVLHGFAFTIYFGFVYNFFAVTAEYANSIQKILPVIFIILWLLFSPWAIARFVLPKVNGWKQLHVLVYIAYISVVTHAWYAAVSYQDSWIKYGFLTIVGFVISLHAIGWIKMLVEWLNRKHYEPIELNGEKYYEIDDINNFVEGVGKKYVINRVPIAVFKLKDKFIAVSNICAHQGGPIYQGKIVNGYIECPWHNWQYSIENGCGPEGFADCIPYFPTLVQDDKLFVSLKRIRKK